MPTAAMPALFFGHGNPMNALETNAYTEAWRAIGRSLPRPRAILAVSAHWYLPSTRVTAANAPRTVHDFGGFPRALYEVRYDAPGDPALADRVAALLAPTPVWPDEEWGLDHGTWSVLCHVFPDADVPVVQLSIDETQPPAWHYALARRLAPLRDEGVLVVGSGNIVHNLRYFKMNQPDPLDWAQRFDEDIAERIVEGHHEGMLGYETLGPDSHLAIPSPEHYLPLLYVLALQREDDPVEFFNDEVMSAISMRSVLIGQP